MRAAFLTADDAAEWDDAPRVVLGEASPGVGKVVASVGVVLDDGRRWRIDLCHGLGYSHRSEVRCVGPVVHVGYGEQTAVFRPSDARMWSYPLDGYFGGFDLPADLDGADADGRVFATSASELLRFGADGVLEWRASGLGIDGVVLHRIAGDTIEGSGEWDPPGGWKPFRVRLSTGERLAPE